MKKRRGANMQAMISTVAAFAVAALAGLAPAEAADDGAAMGCDAATLLSRGEKLENGRRVFNEEDIRAVAYQLDTQVYAAAAGPAPGPRKLGFSEHTFVVDPGVGTPRIK